MAMHNKTVSAVFVGVFGLVLYVTYPTWSNLLSPAPAVFTQDQWRETHKYRRATMAQDFLVRQPYIGMHRDAVIRLLGTPDQQYSGRLHYFVAITTADYMALTFELDSAGLVTKAYLHQT